MTCPKRQIGSIRVGSSDRNVISVPLAPAAHRFDSGFDAASSVETLCNASAVRQSRLAPCRLFVDRSTERAMVEEHSDEERNLTSRPSSASMVKSAWPVLCLRLLPSPSSGPRWEWPS